MQLQEVHTWVAEAGAIALQHFNVVEAHTKADRSVVTAADVEIETVIRERLRAAYPDHGIIGEEQGQSPPGAEYLWAIDPIDGTSGFVHGLPIWGISVGLLRRGIPILGCFYMPLLNEWYEVDVEGPATFNGRPMHTTSTDLLGSEAWLGVPSNVHRRYRIDFPGKVRSLGSIAAYLCYTARGTATGALIGRPHLWDIAAGLAILYRAGGEARTLMGGDLLDMEPLIRGDVPPEPLVAGSPAAVAMMRERITVIPFNRSG